MAIYKKKTEELKNHVRIENEFISNTVLSVNARIIHIYLISKPDNWIVNVKDIQSNCCPQIGIRTIYRALHELSEAGYAKSKTIVKKYLTKNNKEATQLAGKEYDIYQQSQIPDMTKPDLPKSDISGFVHNIKKDQLEKKNTTNNLPKDEEKKKENVVVSFDEKYTMFQHIAKALCRPIDHTTIENWYTHFEAENQGVNSPLKRWIASYLAWEELNPPPVSVPMRQSRNQYDDMTICPPKPAQRVAATTNPN